MLETKIEELRSTVLGLTAAVMELTKSIGGMQAPYVSGNFIPPASFEQAIPQAQWTAEQCAAVAARQQAQSPLPNEPSPTTTDTSPTSAEESKPALIYADNVKPITLRLSKEKGRETAIAVLQRFGVKGAQDLDAGQWADYIAHCEKVLAGGEV